MRPYLLGVDTETTGVEVDKGDKIIEIALIQYDFDGAQIDKYIQRIDPEREINPKAQAVHGISYADLVSCPKFADVAPIVSELMSDASLLIAHNFAFDGQFISTELANVGAPIPKTPFFCTMENGRWATFDGKFPKLSELCLSLGVHYNPVAAHSADYDVLTMMECFFKARERGFFQVKL